MRHEIATHDPYTCDNPGCKFRTGRMDYDREREAATPWYMSGWALLLGLPTGVAIGALIASLL